MPMRKLAKTTLTTRNSYSVNPSSNPCRSMKKLFLLFFLLMAGHLLKAQNTATGSGNVFLGKQAGYGETGSNKLYIENSTNTTTPLLYGDFSTRQLSINAKPTGSYTLTVGGTVQATAFYANGVLISPTQSQWT